MLDGPHSPVVFLGAQITLKTPTSLIRRIFKGQSQKRGATFDLQLAFMSNLRPGP